MDARQQGTELYAIVTQHLLMIDNGETISRQDFLDTHHQHADELRRFFEDLDSVGELLEARIDPLATALDLESTGRIGRFQLLSKVGEGSFGVVWRAYDPTLQRQVAIKVPHHGNISDKEAELFFREAGAAAQLRHPNIVQIHEVDVFEGQPFLVTDLIDGEPLSRWIQNYRPSTTEATRICRSIADAVHHAHANGVIHRDLKPANILIDQDKVPYVTDFGLAKWDSGDKTLTVDGSIIGTPAYMPPEQANGRGHDADPRNDVYSLGAVYFHLLTSEKPFRGDSRNILIQVLTQAPPRPQSLESTVTSRQEAVCLKCLQKEPADRYQTAAELRDDLTRLLDDRPISADAVGTDDRRWAHRVLQCSLLLLLVAVVGIAIRKSPLATNTRDELSSYDATRSNKSPSAWPAAINFEVHKPVRTRADIPTVIGEGATLVLNSESVDTIAAFCDLLNRFPVALKGITLQGPSITDEVFESIGNRPLQSVDMSQGVELTLHRLEVLASSGHLRTLQLAGTPTEDGVIEELPLLFPRLSTLGIADVPIRDHHVKHISSMAQLTDLVIRNNFVTDEGAAHLVHLTSLQLLDISNCAITDECISTLLQLPRLETLTLDANTLSIDGIKELAKHPPLKQLNLSAMPQLSDTSIKDLSQFGNLEVLDISYSSITRKGAVSLAGMLPGVEVRHHATND